MCDHRLVFTIKRSGDGMRRATASGCPASHCPVVPSIDPTDAARRDAAMSIEFGRQPLSSPGGDDTGGRITTVEGAEELRRHAAEIGDYAMAQRWLWHERQL